MKFGPNMMNHRDSKILGVDFLSTFFSETLLLFFQNSIVLAKNNQIAEKIKIQNSTVVLHTWSKFHISRIILEGVDQFQLF